MFFKQKGEALSGGAQPNKASNLLTRPSLVYFAIVPQSDF